MLLSDVLTMSAYMQHIFYWQFKLSHALNRPAKMHSECTRHARDCQITTIARAAGTDDDHISISPEPRGSALLLSALRRSGHAHTIVRSTTTTTTTSRRTRVIIVCSDKHATATRELHKQADTTQHRRLNIASTSVPHQPVAYKRAC